LEPKGKNLRDVLKQINVWLCETLVQFAVDSEHGGGLATYFDRATESSPKARIKQASQCAQIQGGV
jgi:hypothetical protein